MLGSQFFSIICFALFVVTSVSASGESGESMNQMRARKADFERVKFYLSEKEHLSSSEKSDLKSLLRRREIDKARDEKNRENYVRNHPTSRNLDAVQREIIEDKIQDKLDKEQEVRERKYALAEERKRSLIAQAHLEINGSEEYDLHLPSKKDHAKVKATSSSNSKKR